MHTHQPMPVAMRIAADGANAGPARSSPARGAAGGSNLGSPVQATCGALALPAPAAASPSPAATGPTPRATHRHHHHHHHHHLLEHTTNQKAEAQTPKYKTTRENAELT
ncbi:hypothetical protein DFH11DRAFT_1732682 [Phellopilus nigrolimitatus]|nr:hypothetical protein DFH11DRAFT_1732682 [Phellopilus nigrolimitatus]